MVLTRSVVFVEAVYKGRKRVAKRFSQLIIIPRSRDQIKTPKAELLDYMPLEELERHKVKDVVVCEDIATFCTRYLCKRAIFEA